MIAPEFTFQSGNTSPLEILEWERTWFDHPDDGETTRFFYIGDSISWDLRRHCTGTWGETIRMDALATSKALDNPYFRSMIQLMKAQQIRVDHVLFNNGLHGWHLEDETEYAVHYAKMLDFLKEEYPDATLTILLTTRVADPADDARVEKRNKAVRKIAEERGLPIIDLEAVSEECRPYLNAVHFKSEGYQILAKHLIEKVEMMK